MNERREKPRRSSLMTDFYEISMVYTQWKAGRADRYAIFDLFYRTTPFNGQYAVHVGQDDVLDFLDRFCFLPEEVEYLKRLPVCSHFDPEFFVWLPNLRTNIKVWAPPEGTLMFPRVPMLRVEGPICLPQLIETANLCLTNYASQIATNASRMRLAAGRDAILMEFGLRRAPGPDGALTASKCSVMGGFNSTSNVEAGFRDALEISGTHAHSFVEDYSEEALQTLRYLRPKTGGNEENFTSQVLERQNDLKEYFPSRTNQGELAAFIDYGCFNPDRFLALIDTYHVEMSGLPNYLAVALALADFGYAPRGIRLDSGDLAYLSLKVYDAYELIQARFRHCDYDFTKSAIVASNDISEKILWDLRLQKHRITHFGIGTSLVNCGALGCVYKLVQSNGRPVIKLSMSSEKMTIPGGKRAVRLYGKDGLAILDLMIADDEYDEVLTRIQSGDQEILCRDPFNEMKRCLVIPASFKELNILVFDGKRLDRQQDIMEIQEHVLNQLETEMRADHLRVENPTPFKVSVTELLYQRMHKLMASEAPISRLG